ncbi:hypothetical protein OIDMADRAFT_127126 [Oidiodendron maius Zn]|uniref:Transcription activator GCR1-like domain-containing protein n=1 Tax=Oidiodendron maius (strain Zn) TaxID=913774 RepID=A0A0C3GT83_OIDMZ|nr:hypothetical protein OIDMADRAFT_127126 [Oidiodendron maius Zn]
MEFPGHPIFQDPVFETSEYRAFELRVRGTLAIAVEQDPDTIAIQRAISAINDHLHTMTGVIQNGQVTHAQALCSLDDLLTTRIEQKIESIAGALKAPQLQYRMSRTIQTIPELWQEWTVGLQGQPSIERLDELHGSSWRSGPAAASERQFYSRRKTLIAEIRRLAAAIKAPPDKEAYNSVVLRLEDERKRAGASLSKVIDALKRA